MVATSLPFWMPHQSRTMSLFTNEAASRPDRSGLALRTILTAQDGAVVERRGAEDMAHHIDAWRALIERALEPNVYLEPGFALSAAKHFAPARRPAFLLVWSKVEADAAPRLIGLCPVQGERAGFVRAWAHEQATLSAPLLDRDHADAALDALLGWVRQRSPDSAGLLVAGIQADGPLMRLLSGRERRVAVIDRRTRAILLRSEAGAAPAGSLSAKHAKDLRRQQRRLAQEGTLTFRTASGADAVRGAAERFLELEARGWKGARGTALLVDSGLVTFVRTMTRLMARDGRCRIHSLDVDGLPIAMGIVLLSGDRAYFWKTAYDETRGALSPGKLFASMLTAELAGDPTVALTDSCAVPDHPMIDRLWSDRMIVADVLVGAASTPPEVFRRAVRDLGLWRRCRTIAKAGLHRMRRFLSGHRAS